jgi:hypothetical protein
MRSLCLGLLMVSALGCSAVKDPCEGEAGACITARIEGSGVAVLDQLRFTIDNPVVATTNTPSSPSLFGLPVKLALVLPAAATGTVNVSVEGMEDGKVVARSAPQRITVPAAGTRSAVTFVLTSVTGGGDDMGVGGDMSGNVDLSPTDDLLKNGFVIEASAQSFPDTVRGQRSTTLITLTLTNKGSQTINVNGTPTAVGDTNSFVADNSTTCSMMMNSFTPMQSCKLVYLFSPQKSGALTSTTDIMFTDGSMTSFTLRGKGLPTWSNESLAGAPMVDFLAVAGTDSSNVFAGGQTTAAAMVSSVWRYNGTQWTAYNTKFLFDLYTVTALAVAPGHVWAGGPSSISHNTGTGGDWTNEIMALNGRVRGIYGDSLNNGFAATESMSSAFLIRELAGAAYTWNPNGVRSFFTAICGNSKSQIYVFSGAAFQRWDGNSFAGSLPGILGEVQSCWFDPIASAVYAVSYDKMAPNAGRLYRIGINTATGNWDGNTPAVEKSAAGTDYRAIHGRHLATGERDMWMGGTFGGIMYSNGNGTWTQQPIPITTNINSIYVAPDGQVFAVGYQGDIAHYY